MLLGRDGWHVPVAFHPSVSGQSGVPPPLWPPACLSPQLLPSALSVGLWQVPATEAVYSGVHPCLERAQRGDGGGEEVHSEVGSSAGPPPLPGLQASFPLHPEPLTPLTPGEELLAFRGPKRLIFYEGLLRPPGPMWSEALACCVTLSQSLYPSDPLSSAIHRGCHAVK